MTPQSSSQMLTPIMEDDDDANAVDGVDDGVNGADDGVNDSDNDNQKIIL